MYSVFISGYEIGKDLRKAANIGEKYKAVLICSIQYLLKTDTLKYENKAIHPQPTWAFIFKNKDQASKFVQETIDLEKILTQTIIPFDKVKGQIKKKAIDEIYSK